MKSYIVGRREVWVDYVRVEADSIEEAMELTTGVATGDENLFEYSHTLEPDTWTVEEVA